MKILIYEDNQEDLKNLLKCIETFFSITEVPYATKICTDSTYILTNHFNFDLLFLDIEVFGESGIDLGYKIRKQNPDIRIVFVTNYSKYLTDGYKAQANRYFVKPIQQEEFNIELSNVISDYLDEYDGFYDESLSFKKIYFKNILYIEYINRKTKIHFISGEEIITGYSLKYWYEKMESKDFAQSYKSLIVNLKHISGFTKNEVILDNEEHLPISRLSRQEFEKKYVEALHKRI